MYDIFLPQENGINLLKLRAVDPEKYSLQLMDFLFTDQEMASSCYVASQRTKKPGLDAEKIALLEGNYAAYDTKLD